MGSDYSLYEKKLDNPRFSIIAIDKRFLFPNPKIFNIQQEIVALIHLFKTMMEPLILE